MKIKVGDVVRVKSVNGYPFGIVIDIEPGTTWPYVLTETGKIVIWPDTQLELIHESR